MAANPPNFGEFSMSLLEDVMKNWNELHPAGVNFNHVDENPHLYGRFLQQYNYEIIAQLDAPHKVEDIPIKNHVEDCYNDYSDNTGE
jgi:hypothetical protein